MFGKFYKWLTGRQKQDPAVSAGEEKPVVPVLGDKHIDFGATLRKARTPRERAAVLKKIHMLQPMEQREVLNHMSRTDPEMFKLYISWSRSLA